MAMRRFRPGESVEFRHKRSKGSYRGNDVYEIGGAKNERHGIPGNLIKNGLLLVSDSHKAVVVDHYGSVNIVKYQAADGTTVVLGFDDSDLIDFSSAAMSSMASKYRASQMASNMNTSNSRLYQTALMAGMSPGDISRLIGDLELEEIQEKKKAPASKDGKLDLAHLDALILDDKLKADITDVLKQHKNAKKLFDEWGLGEVLEYGKGMTFLFYGKPGTGKTHGATCIAKAMGTELITIGQAEIQSSEPGAANRNIQNAFKEAKESGKVLFIDECDSLIASREHLGMILAGEVNTLLTEIEKFEGVVILATNRVEHMDEALERRIALIAEFPLPDLESRKKIWTRMLPKKMPLGEDVKIEELAEKELSGGQIKNVVLGAARAALANDEKEVSKVRFTTAIENVLKNKGLMGTAYGQKGVMRQDGMSVDTGKKRIVDFIKKVEE